MAHNLSPEDTKRYNQINEWMLPEIAAMRASTGAVQSWHFRRSNRSHSILHFTVTWTPYTVTISGDAGSAVFECNGFATALAAAETCRRAEFGYLMGKSSHKQEYDPKASAAALVQRMYEELRSMSREERKTYCHYADDVTEYRLNDGLERRSYFAFILENGISLEDMHGLEREYMAQYSYASMEPFWHYCILKAWAAHVIANQSFLKRIAQRLKSALPWR